MCPHILYPAQPLIPSLRCNLIEAMQADISQATSTYNDQINWKSFSLRDASIFSVKLLCAHNKTTELRS